jgi:hypothetical protein
VVCVFASWSTKSKELLDARIEKECPVKFSSHLPVARERRRIHSSPPNPSGHLSQGRETPHDPGRRTEEQPLLLWRSMERRSLLCGFVLLLGACYGESSQSFSTNPTAEAAVDDVSETEGVAGAVPSVEGSVPCECRL